MSDPVPESESLSIGEILDLLQAEFPDVTLSKIRFLESQGLLDPERTASGYRKFYPADVDRLRWILRQQRENFLPLKVIKGRLEAEGDEVMREEAIAPSLPSSTGHDATVPVGRSRDEAASPGVPPPSPAGGAPPPAPTAAAPTTSATGAPEGDLSSLTFTRDELAKASGLSPADLAQLERHGLLVGTSVGRQLQYDGEALVVARLAAAFASHGVEPRHLRMDKNSAEREAGFYEQVVLPYMKQRNPAARRQALDTLHELCRLGEGLRNALLRRALSDLATEPEVRRRG
ncbi:MerR family transcriptional regulator [soil metagenome]